MRIEKRKAKKAKKGVTYRIKVDYIDEYGIKRTYSKSGFETKKEAREHGIEIEHELQEKGTLTKECSKTLNDCFLESMELEKDRLARNTVIHYMDTFKNHVKDEKIAQLPISKLNYTMIQRHFNGLSYQGKSLVTTQKNIFNRAFKHAVKSGYIHDNPMANVEVSYAKSKKETYVLTESDLERIVEYFLSINTHFNRYSYCMVMYCGYYLGLRLTEILALEKSDFDFDNDVVYISKKLETRHLKKDEMYITDEMKTSGSKAVLPIPAPLKTILLEWFAFNPYDLVCCCEDGSVISEQTFRTRCMKAKEKTGIDFHPHSLRHTYITNIVRSGCDIKTASKLARHSNVQTTLDVYAHTDESTKKDAINKVFGEFCPKNDPK
ncbi:site-specific integrase, partial [uncultured Dubosiella sp.]